MKRAALVVVALLVLAALGAARGLLPSRQARLARRARARRRSSSCRPQTVPVAAEGAGCRLADVRPRPGASARLGDGLAPAPPFRQVWTFRAQSLIEFPPAIALRPPVLREQRRRDVRDRQAENGLKAWSSTSHRCQAASPAVDRHLVFQVFLNTPPCNRPYSSALTGEVDRLRRRLGHGRWRKRSARPRRARRSCRASSTSATGAGASMRSPSAPASAGGRRSCTARSRAASRSPATAVFVGDYSRHVYALNAASGKRALEGERAAAVRRHAGGFYATPSVAYGRVYVGATDGKVYSFGAASGKLRWSTVDRRLRLLVDGRLARPGLRRLVLAPLLLLRRRDRRRSAGSSRRTGRSPGSPTVIAGRVYFATLSGHARTR